MARVARDCGTFWDRLAADWAGDATGDDLPLFAGPGGMRGPPGLLSFWPSVVSIALADCATLGSDLSVNQAAAYELSPV